MATALLQPRLVPISTDAPSRSSAEHPEPAPTFSPREMCSSAGWHFGTLPAAIRQSKELSDTSKLLWSALAEMEATMDEVRPGHARLAAEIGKSVSTVIRAIDELRREHLIEVLEQPRRGVRPQDSTNIYRFLLSKKYFPEALAAPCTSSKSGTSVRNETSSKRSVELVAGMTDKIRPMSKTITHGSGESVSEIAGRLHQQHPRARRDIGAALVEAKLKTIVRHKRLRTADQIGYLLAVERHHQRLCQSTDWIKDGGIFAKALSNWLAPTQGRYEPPDEPSSSLFRSQPEDVHTFRSEEDFFGD